MNIQPLAPGIDARIEGVKLGALAAGSDQPRPARVLRAITHLCTSVGPS